MTTRVAVKHVKSYRVGGRDYFYHRLTNERLSNDPEERALRVLEINATLDGWRKEVPPPPKRPRQRPERRDGDRKQARRRVHYLVRAGRLPRASDVPCTDCGHICGEDGTPHHYDHYRGYDAAHHEDVQVVCAPCHYKRDRRRRDRMYRDQIDVNYPI